MVEHMGIDLEIIGSNPAPAQPLEKIGLGKMTGAVVSQW